MSAEKNGSVVLVHGLWLHGTVFFALRRWLARQGFAVHALSYPSVRVGLYENARALAERVRQIEGDSISLVGHSLGGLVILNMLENFPDSRVKRVVLMGSPYGGSHCAAVLLRTPLAPIIGNSLGDWLAIDASQRFDVRRQGVEIGVLAGDRSIGLGRLIGGLPRPNDGVVSLDETRVPGSRDAITLPVAHSQMPFSRACAAQVASFLATGSFIHA
jgi:pimeloyl-ACP methyl ester carboxylesterase